MYLIGQWQFDETSHKLKNDGQLHVLEPQLSQLLLYLAKNRDRVLSRDELIENVWGTIVSDAAINQAIAKLRRLLGDEAKSPMYIATVAKRGYQLIANVEHITQQGTASESIDTLTDKLANATKHSFRLAFAVGSLVVLTLIYYFISSFFIQSDSPPAITQLAPITSLPGMEVNPTFNPKNEDLVVSYKSPTSKQWDLMMFEKTTGHQRLLQKSDDASELRAAWSPDGTQLAYVKHSRAGCQLRLMSPYLADPSDQFVTECSPFDIQLQWHPQGEKLLFNKRALPLGPLRVYSIDIITKHLKELSQANEGITGDIAFSLSPDGNQLAFVRTHHWNQSAIWLKDLVNNTTTHLENFPYWIRTLAWEQSNENLLFSAAPDYQVLNRFNVYSKQVEAVLHADYVIEDTAYVESKNQLTLVQNRFQVDIHAMLNPRFGDQKEEQIIINSSRNDWHPKISPDGKHLAFLTNRTGQVELWTKDLSTNNESVLLKESHNLTPGRFDWEKESDAIVFDTAGGELYRVNLIDPTPNLLTPNTLQARNPTATEEGIYFAGRSDASWQLHQLDHSGDIKQVNEKDAFSAYPNSDNELIYTKFYLAGFWMSDLKTGEEKQVIEQGSQGPFNQWQVTKNGIYYLASSPTGTNGVFYFSFEEQQSQLLLDFYTYDYNGFSVSPDEQLIMFTRVKNQEADVLGVVY